MKLRALAVALVLLGSLSCSISYNIIVANMTSDALTVRAQLANYTRESIYPELATVRAIDGYSGWYTPPVGSATVDTVTRTIQVIVPPGTAVRLAHSHSCYEVTCENFPVRWVELAGTAGSHRLEGWDLRTGLAVDGYRWTIWYPLQGAHDVRTHMHRAQVTMLLLALAVAAFTITCAVIIARSPIPHRWGWAAVALLGFGRFTINWTTGGMDVDLVSLPVLVGSFARSDVLSPWVLAFSFPAGALFALIHRHCTLMEREGELTSVMTADPATRTELTS